MSALPTIAGVILAAGESSRMGRPKALLSLVNTTFLQHIITTLQQADIDPIIVVLGHQPETIRAGVDLTGVEVVINEQYQQGQLSSLRTALKCSTVQNADGVMICLVDHPFMTATVVRSLRESFGQRRAPVTIPSYRRKRGHPVIFASQVFQELLDTPVDAGARVVVEAHREAICYVETDEEGILWDIDTPEKYDAARKKFC